MVPFGQNKLATWPCGFRFQDLKEIVGGNPVNFFDLKSEGMLLF